MRSVIDNLLKLLCLKREEPVSAFQDYCDAYLNRGAYFRAELRQLLAFAVLAPIALCVAALAISKLIDLCTRH